jgi:Mg-chelatase subunit ChlI
MTVEKKEIVELQKAVARKIKELQDSSGDSVQLFDLNMLDSHISLFLLAAEFKDDPIKLGADDKYIVDALKKFRNEKKIQLDAEDLLKEVSASVRETLEILDQLDDLMEKCGEKVLTENFRMRIDFSYELLKQLENLQSAPRRILKQWQSEKIPLPLSTAGKLLGSAKSEKKSASSRANGKKGGRPPKNKTGSTEKKSAEKPAEKKSSSKSTATKSAEKIPAKKSAEKKSAARTSTKKSSAKK